MGQSSDESRKSFVDDRFSHRSRTWTGLGSRGSSHLACDVTTTYLKTIESLASRVDFSRTSQHHGGREEAPARATTSLQRCATHSQPAATCAITSQPSRLEYGPRQTCDPRICFASTETPTRAGTLNPLRDDKHKLSSSSNQDAPHRSV